MKCVKYVKYNPEIKSSCSYLHADSTVRLPHQLLLPQHGTVAMPKSTKR